MLGEPLTVLHPIVLKHLTQETIDYINENARLGLQLPFKEPISRNQYLLKRFFMLAKNSSKVYMTVHLVLMVIRLVRAKKDRLKIVMRAGKDLVKSVLFATLFAMSIPGCYTYLKTVNPRVETSWSGFRVSHIFSWAILFESSSRWGEMSLYTLAQWFEGFTYSLYKRKYLPTVSNWAKYVMMVSMAILSFCYYSPYFNDTAEEEIIRKSMPEGEKKIMSSRTKLDFFLRFILGTKHIGK